MIGCQFGHHTLNFTVKRNGSVHHIIKDLGYIGAEFEVTGLVYFILENLIFAHCKKNISRKVRYLEGIEPNRLKNLIGI